MKKSEREQTLEIAEAVSEAVSECIKTSYKDKREDKLDAIVDVINQYKTMKFPDHTINNNIEIYAKDKAYIVEIVEYPESIEITLTYSH